MRCFWDAKENPTWLLNEREVDDVAREYVSCTYGVCPRYLQKSSGAFGERDSDHVTGLFNFSRVFAHLPSVASKWKLCLLPPSSSRPAVFWSSYACTRPPLPVSHDTSALVIQPVSFHYSIFFLSTYWCLDCNEDVVSGSTLLPSSFDASTMATTSPANCNKNVTGAITTTSLVIDTGTSHG